MKSDEFCTVFTWILCGYRKDSVQLTAELYYYFRRVCLPVPQNDTLLSADLFLPSYHLCSLWNGYTVYDMAHKLRTGSYVRTLNTMQSSSASKYVCSCHMYVRCTSVVTIEALTCSLPVLLGWRLQSRYFLFEHPEMALLCSLRTRYTALHL